MTMSSSPLDAHNSHFILNPSRDHHNINEEPESEHSDGDTASQRSISLSSPSNTRPTSVHLGVHDDTHETEPAITPVTFIRQGLLNSNSNRDSHPYTLDTDSSSEHDADDRSSFMRRLEETESPVSSLAPSLHELYDKTDGRGNERVSPEQSSELAGVVSELVVSGNERPPATPPTATYPPPQMQKPDYRGSIASFASNSTSQSKKARPESVSTLR